MRPKDYWLEMWKMKKCMEIPTNQCDNSSCSDCRYKNKMLYVKSW